MGFNSGFKVLSNGPNKKITQILANTYDMEADISYIYIVSRKVYIS